MDYIEGYQTGNFLVAAPGIQDERFDKTVLYIFSHDKNGAAGLILNKPSEYIDFIELCDQLSISPKGDQNKYTLFEGGPVESNRGYVLHSNDFSGRDTEDIGDTGLRITTTVDIIKRIAEGKGPKNAIICLGYASWGAGQLEREITRHGWLHAKADNDIIFNIHHSSKWQKVIEGMGLSLGGLAEYSGRA